MNKCQQTRTQQNDQKTLKQRTKTLLRERGKTETYKERERGMGELFIEMNVLRMLACALALKKREREGKRQRERGVGEPQKERCWSKMSKEPPT